MSFTASSERIAFDLYLERIRNDTRSLEEKAAFLAGGDVRLETWHGVNLDQSEKALRDAADHVKSIHDRIKLVRLANAEEIRGIRAAFAQAAE